MRNRKPPIICPDVCSGGIPSRQYQLAEGQLAQISAAARKAIEKSSGSDYRCSYCGCVYLKQTTGKLKLGYLDGGVTGKGWSSSNFP